MEITAYLIAGDASRSPSSLEARARELRACAVRARAEGRAGDAWDAERQAAACAWSASSKRAREGFYDHALWLRGRAAALQAWRRALDARRRREGDGEILRALDALEGGTAPGGWKVTPARRRVAAAVVRIAAGTGRLYCGYGSLARIAGVSTRTACAVRSELEAMGAIERVRTGGLASSGARQSNKYTVKYNALREALGVANRWPSRYRSGSSLALAFAARRVANPWYNYEGFAHYSRSERQRRRLAKRARDAARDVENRRQSTSGSAGTAANRHGNGQLELGFCALTELKNQNRSNEPGTTSQVGIETDVENRTRLRRSDYGRPAGGIGTPGDDLQDLPEPMGRLLRSLPERRRGAILAEARSMIPPWTAGTAEGSFHAQCALQAIIDAEQSLTNLMDSLPHQGGAHAPQQ